MKWIILVVAIFQGENVSGRSPCNLVHFTEVC